MRLNEIYETYREEVEFFLVYIREAHPSNGWQTPQNLYEKIIYRRPVSVDERAVIADACQIDLGLNLPMLIDNMDDEVEEKYIAEPIRLYVIDGDGSVAFNGAPGRRDTTLMPGKRTSDPPLPTALEKTGEAAAPGSGRGCSESRSMVRKRPPHHRAASVNRLPPTPADRQSGPRHRRALQG